MAIKTKEDPRMRRTRKLLQAALIQLLKEKPLAKIQIKEIVEKAELSRPTFYKQFETKEQLLFSHVDDMFEKISTDVFAEAQKGKGVDMITLVIASFEQWRLHKEELHWILQVENKDLVFKRLHSHLKRLKQEFDKFVPPLDLALAYDAYLTSFVLGGMYMLVKTWLENGAQESPEKMASMTFMLLFNGFSPMRSVQAENNPLLEHAIQVLRS